MSLRVYTSHLASTCMEMLHLLLGGPSICAAPWNFPPHKHVSLCPAKSCLAVKPGQHSACAD